jgi:hypothetical protein
VRLPTQRFEVSGSLERGDAKSVESGYLPGPVEEHPDSSYGMPVYGAAMRKVKRAGDSIVNEPPRRESAALSSGSIA